MNVVQLKTREQLFQEQQQEESIDKMPKLKFNIADPEDPNWLKQLVPGTHFYYKAKVKQGQMDVGALRAVVLEHQGKVTRLWDNMYQDKQFAVVSSEFSAVFKHLETILIQELPKHEDLMDQEEAQEAQKNEPTTTDSNRPDRGEGVESSPEPKDVS